MNTAIVNDIRRAIWRPAYWSRTSAIVTTRGDDTPMPCSTRPAIIISKLRAKMLMRHPAMNSTRPAWMAGLRPIRSDSGPKTIWPMLIPRNTAVMTNWTSLRLATPRSSPMAGSAGSIASIARATSDISSAISGTNSPTRSAGVTEVWLISPSGVSARCVSQWTWAPIRPMGPRELYGLPGNRAPRPEKMQNACS